MLTLDVDPHVLKSLQAAFPTPADSAARALGKYVQLLERMLYESSLRVQPAVQRKLGLFDISLHDLANRGGQIGPKKVRVHAWLKAQGLSLVEAVVPGSKFTGKISQVKLSKWVRKRVRRIKPINSALNTRRVRRADDLLIIISRQGLSRLGKKPSMALIEPVQFSRATSINFDDDHGTGEEFRPIRARPR